MSVRSILNLIRASGGSGVTGQSWRNNVAGSPATDDHVSYWNVDAWAWDGPSGPSVLGWPYASGSQWVIPIAFTEGSKAKSIRRTATDGLGDPIRVVSYSADAAIVGEDIAIIARTISNSASTASATLRLISSMPPTGQTVAVDGYSTEYGHSTPPAGVLVEMVDELVATSPGTLRNVTYTIDIDYIPDIGNYNPTLTKQYVIQATDRNVASADLDVLWYADSGGTNLVGASNPVYRTQDLVGQDFFLYYKWRLQGSGNAYTALAGPAGYDDPRLV